jgi:hypothetical protein
MFDLGTGHHPNVSGGDDCHSKSSQTGVSLKHREYSLQPFFCTPPVLSLICHLASHTLAPFLEQGVVEDDDKERDRDEDDV